jgi:predicted RNA binding protein YcfA (HicA-like mRNA interferase family)
MVFPGRNVPRASPAGFARATRPLIRTFGVTCSYCRICRINVIQLYESNREADTECLSGTSDTNIAFKDLCRLLIYLGFDVRTKGSHHIFRKAGVEEKINLQKDGNKAKPYQVKQVRAVILTYKLGGVK